MTNKSIPRIEYLQVQNYRALKKVELKDIKPISVFLGPIPKLMSGQLRVKE